MNQIFTGRRLPFFEWQDIYAANLNHRQQVARAAHTVSQAAQQNQTAAAPIVELVIELRPTQGAPAVHVCPGHVAGRYS
jgi:hypothetical protein